MHLAQSTSNSNQRMVTSSGSNVVSRDLKPLGHKDRIRKELLDLGVSWLGLSTMASRYLPNIIHFDEHVQGVVYGHSDEGSVMLVATNRRIVFLNKRLLFINEDEINYGFVSGLSFDRSRLWLTVVLHTRVKDYAIRTFNSKCAEGFVRYIESRCLENTNNKGWL